ncbi:hypothetical protein SteCoe_12180 [Stentor coeruleus]|uniref:Uncharacterized protein n=1 Tax=Stentor coeruleus TaxID=5963 RepID=A0A1R2CBE6_9CILI|nr:hypothetical protein SteCoe_12180 [Stentor coeruleus]
MDLEESLSDNFASDHSIIATDDLTEIEIESLRLEFYLETKETLDEESPSLPLAIIPIIENSNLKPTKGKKHKKYLNSLLNFEFISKRKNLLTKPTQSKKPKKEYVRTKLIRGHKRAQRQCLQELKPEKTIHKINQNNKHQLKSWDAFKNHVISLSDVIKETSKTENGPLTDGRNRRFLDSINKDVPKTCNDEFVKDYFKSIYMRESFKLYINVIFSGQKPKDLCERFGFSCCNRSNHLARCKEIWAELYEQLRNEFIDVHVNNLNNL